MRNPPISPALIAGLFSATFCLTGCDRSENIAAAESPLVAAESALDVPILPVHPGDSWRYDVHVEMQAGVSGPNSAAVDTHQELVRKYLGKVVVGHNLPDTECFEVSSPGSPKEREFVEIHPDKVLLRGSTTMGAKTTKPVWLDPPVLFVAAGMQSGAVIPEIHDKENLRKRKTEVVGRETVSVPAGDFPAIRMLMTGVDGPVEMRRTIWFSPGTGIVREEKARYHEGKLLFRETRELLETTIKR